MAARCERLAEIGITFLDSFYYRKGRKFVPVYSSTVKVVQKLALVQIRILIKKNLADQSEATPPKFQQISTAGRRSTPENLEYTTNPRPLITGTST